MLKYLLDTNILIYTLRNRPVQVKEIFRRHDKQIGISSVSYGELVYGAEKSSQPEDNLAVIQAMIARLRVLPFDEEAARHTGQLRLELFRTNRSLGPYDTMIAGHARSTSLILVTNKMEEFGRISGLRLESLSKLIQ